MKTIVLIFSQEQTLVVGIVKKEIIDSSSSNIMSFAPSAGQQRQQSVLKNRFFLYSSSTAK